ncbi:MAG TPA: hypothetical protein VN408_11430 [Actinoplanes sp.]|nr:hypothetical protein [Actinoplanes sp.]
MLFRLAYLGVTNTLALLRLLPMSDHNKDAEIPRCGTRSWSWSCNDSYTANGPSSRERTGHGLPPCCTRCREPC